MKNLFSFNSLTLNYSVLAKYDSWRHEIIQKLAEAIVGFATTNITLKIVLLVLNIPLYFLLGRLIFGSWERFLKMLKKSVVLYVLGPFLFLFYRKRERVQDALVSRSEIGLSTLVDVLWIGLYTLEYLSIKALFLS